MEALLEGEAEQLLRKAIKLAAAGNIHALQLCLDRLLPPRKDRPIHLSLPPIENQQQVSSAMSMVVGAIGDGRITPGEGEILANILAVQANVLATGDLESRMERLEQARATDQEEKVDPEAADLVQVLNAGRLPPVVEHEP
jgi:hypothetical protein